MEHSHAQPARAGQRELGIALLLTAAVMVLEVVVGWFSGSLALLADAGHMLADAWALALSFFAAWLAARPATLEKTYGYYRTEILVALANGVALWIIVVCIYARALTQLREPAEVQSGPMIATAAVGLSVNLLCGWMLRKARAGNLNVQGAWLNVMSDALGSVGVIIAGGLIRWRGWMAADPIASMIIGLLIASNSWGLVTQSVNILLEGTPGHLRIPDVVRTMRAVPGVRDVHDVHLWTITTGMEAMSGHVVIDDVGRSAEILSALTGSLSQQFGITHTTFQLEPRQHVCHMGAAPAVRSG